MEPEVLVLRAGIEKEKSDSAKLTQEGKNLQRRNHDLKDGLERVKREKGRSYQAIDRLTDEVREVRNQAQKETVRLEEDIGNQSPA